LVPRQGLCARDYLQAQQHCTRNSVEHRRWAACRAFGPARAPAVRVAAPRGPRHSQGASRRKRTGFHRRSKGGAWRGVGEVLSAEAAVGDGGLEELAAQRRVAQDPALYQHGLPGAQRHDKAGEACGFVICRQQRRH